MWPGLWRFPLICLVPNFSDFWGEPLWEKAQACRSPPLCESIMSPREPLVNCNSVKACRGDTLLTWKTKRSAHPQIPLHRINPPKEDPQNPNSGSTLKAGGKRTVCRKDLRGQSRAESKPAHPSLLALVLKVQISFQNCVPLIRPKCKIPSRLLSLSAAQA